MISLPMQVLELTGIDAVTFAQAQFCNDVLALADGHWQFNAWLSPQGRVRAFFHLLRHDANTIVLLLRGGEAAWLQAELSRFVFRSKVTLRTVGKPVFGSSSADEVAAQAASVPTNSVVARAQTTAIALSGDTPRWLLFGATVAPEDAPETIAAWHLADVRCGLVEIDATLRDQLLPQWLGLGHLDAVSVRKGCYPGQEIMARMHFKGGNKRSLYRVACACVLPVASVLHDAEGTESGVLVATACSADGRYETLASVQDPKAELPLFAQTSHRIEVLQRFA